MRLLIAYPNPNSYSETFVRDHIKYLEPVATLTNGWMPFQDANRKSIFNGLFMVDVIRGACKKYFPSFYFKQYQKALKSYLKKERIEVVLAEYGITTSNMYEVCYSLGIPITAHFHGFDAYEYKTIANYKDKYLYMSGFLNAIIVVSAEMKQELMKLGISENLINVNSCGVNVDFFNSTTPELNEKIILFTGRFTAKKAPNLTINAFDIVLKKHPDAKLWMIGGGELFESCVKLIKELAIEKSVELLGVKKPSEISNYLKQSKIFVQHSRRTKTGDSEGTPVSVLEASSTGLPIVSTKHAGIKEAVVHGKTGYLVDEGDYQMMAEFIIRLLEDQSSVKDFGAAARQHMIDNYSMSKQIRGIQVILNI